MTSSLQIEASRKLRMDPERTMRAAQRLYEQGWITYMRTDSTTLSKEALNAARTHAREMFGDDYVADVPRTYDRKVKNAQEAHEAIRPAGETFRSLEEATSQLSGDEYAVYDLIWKRTIASQMVDAKLTSDRVRLLATLNDLPNRPGATEVGLSANGLRIEFAGFRRAYVEGSDDPESELADQERLLPPLTEGSTATVALADAKGHDTKPPDRFSEATLIKKLEDLGIGRPSTYASVMKTIDRRGYVWKKGKALVPAFKAFAVVNLLSTYFADLVDYQFTAAMEDSLDAIASGDRELEPWLKSFYFGDAAAPTEFAKRGLHAMVTEQLDFDYAAINSLPLGAGPDGEAVSVRSGRYGPYLVHGERRVSIPEATEPDSLTVTRALELLDAPSGDRELGTDPATGLPVYLKAGRYGPYVQLGELVDGTKPKTASLFSTMSIETITFDDAQKLLSLPREIGAHPENQEMIVATNGRYGPYVMWGKDSRSLESEDEIFSVDLEKALALLAQPKLRGRRAAAGPLRELGPDPITGKEVVVKTGKFGPYVTDGEVNATLRIGDTPETVTIDRACELLAERRNADPTARRAPAKKAAKKSVKKAPAKKAAAKKAGVKKATAAKKATKKTTGGTGRGAKGQGADQSATNADLISRLSGE
jgi:DNA topoisomerase-1